LDVKEVLNRLLDECKERWYLFLLLGIFLLALKIRLLAIDLNWLQAYDPYFHLRYTSYIAENGIMPAWDPLSYFPPGRPTTYPAMMYYLTGYLYRFFQGSFGSLIEAAQYSTAIYGAFMTVPAYLLGKELSDWKGGVASAAIMATIPATIRRTMAGFYDNPALVVFFSILTVYFFARAFRKHDLLDYSAAALSLILFSFTWEPAWYIAFIVGGSTVLYYIVISVFGKEEWKTENNRPSFFERINKGFGPFKKLLVPTVATTLVAIVAAHLLGLQPINRLMNYVTFALGPSDLQIVNVSVAELQNLEVFGMEGWAELFQRFSGALAFFIPGSMLLMKRSKRAGSLLLTWTLVSFFFVTRGVRFTIILAPAAAVAAGVAFSEIYRNIEEQGSYAPLYAFGFLATLFLTMASPAAGFLLGIVLASLMLWTEGEGEVPEISKPVVLATAVLAIIMISSQGIQMAGQQTQEPITDEWEETYEFLKHETAEDAVVGSWWDPGHRIAGIAQRRNMADGYHCLEEYCEDGLNTRISDLGEMLVTDDEDRMVELMERYQEEASEVYWIASEDLIGKYQWPQYFATGCEGGDPQCPLYSQLRYEDQTEDRIIYQGGVYLEFVNDTPVPVYETAEGRGTFERMLYYEEGEDEPTEETFEDEENVIPGTLWVHPQYYMTVLIPEYQEDSMFTRMYFEEGQGVEQFDQVFRNDYVKIYKLNETSQ